MEGFYPRLLLLLLLQTLLDVHLPQTTGSSSCGWGVAVGGCFAAAAATAAAAGSVAAAALVCASFGPSCCRCCLPLLQCGKKLLIAVQLGLGGSAVMRGE
jgi:hypothetical protein